MRVRPSSLLLFESAAIVLARMWNIQLMAAAQTVPDRTHAALQAQAEVDEVLGSSEQPAGLAGYQRLRYLLRCVNESMRLYPHPPVLLRRAQLADELPGATPLNLGMKHLQVNALRVCWACTSSTSSQVCHL